MVNGNKAHNHIGKESEKDNVKWLKIPQYMEVVALRLNTILHIKK